MQVELWQVDRPIPYARNARKLSDAAVDKVAASIKEFGWRQPIVVDTERVVIAGHTRLLAAKKLGLAQVPVHVATELTPAQVKAYRLMDNRSHDESAWDMEMLGVELFDLQSLDMDLGLTGFNEDELAGLMAEKTEGLTDPDEVPETPDEPVTQMGDLWILGKHQLLCGDSTVATDVGRVLSTVMPDLMVTDPPYGVEYDPTWREGRDLGVGKRSKGKVLNDDRADWQAAYDLFPGNIAYVWSADLRSKEVIDSLIASKFTLRSQIIWVKQHFVLGRGDYHFQHEPCWYAVRSKGNWCGDRKQTTVWNIKNNNSFGNQDKEETFGHGTQKPVECMRRPILNNSNAGQCVYDPFLGSGTTLIAAESTGRICFGLEISPAYCDVIVTRWQNFTGKQAALEGGGTFAEAKDARQAVAA